MRGEGPARWVRGPGATTASALGADQGSVTPLMIGMMLILLLLGCGVSAAGSAFLTRQRLQGQCDGAAAVAADAIRPDLSGPQSAAAASAAADDYLSVRGGGVRVGIIVDDAAAQLTCRRTAAISFAGLFDLPDVDFTVTATAEPAFHD